MKNKYNGGYTLVELLVSIVILAAIVIPTCTSLVLSYRMNAKTEDMMQAQLAVSSAVETLMARGITDEFVEAVMASPLEEENQVAGESNEESQLIKGTCDEFPGLIFQLEDKGDYCELIVEDEEGLVEVITNIRDKTTPKDNEGGAAT